MWEQTASLLREHAGSDAELDAARDRFRAAREPLFERVLTGELDTDGFRRGQLAAALPGVALPASVGDAHVALRERLNQTPSAVAGAAQLLDALRADGLKLGVLTNGVASMATGKLAAIGLAGHVDALVTADSAGAPKPSPRAYAAAADALGLPHDAVAMVGDHLEWDVAGPLRVGYAVGVWLWREPGEPQADLPAGAVLVRSLAEVPAVLGRGVPT